MPEDSVKVAVRVRPFNSREKERGAKLVIDMDGATTVIKSQAGEAKSFTFDYSYWSHDQFEELDDGVLKPTGPKYASQDMVFKDLGQGVLNNAFEGYNCSLFAYGQTGSGKSYSMVGYGKNVGIVPMTCNVLFQTMNVNKNDDKRYEVTFSMLEIYNEQVRDLLSKENPRGGLQVRENPKLGIFYVQGIKNVPVGSYEEIEQRIVQGTANRTVASTNMNATSSRAHTVVTITFDQITKDDAGQETKKSSVMNLVDLAGSERADSTGATGDRLKEGANINKSLSALGNVISALADQSMGKKKVRVPYRDSVLTKLLQNALGGNSKTIMIAALSPADINFDETLGTLRYADRAKKIKNNATVNENPMDKLIRELKEENERLKSRMTGGSLEQSTAGMSPKAVEKMRKEMEDEIRAQLEANQAAMSANETSWSERLKEAQKEELSSGGDEKKRSVKELHFTNLNEDPMLSGVIHLFIKMDGATTVGRKGATVPDITLSGLSILEEHAELTVTGGVVELKPASNGAKIKVNGQPMTGSQQLMHKDRVLFGSNHLYVFMNPMNPEVGDDLPKTITYEFAQQELAQAKGFTTGVKGLPKELQIVQEQVLEILPMVSEVNAISEELNKYRSFEVVLISAAAKGTMGAEQGASVMVKLTHLLNGNSWMWERGKFMNRRYIMQDLYQKWLDGEDEEVMGIPEEQDPFWEPAEDVLIGSTNLYLTSLCFREEFDYSCPVKDYKGQDEGKIDIVVTPCSPSGKPLGYDMIVSDSQEPTEAVEELRGKPFNFKVEVVSAKVDKTRFAKGLKVKYKICDDKELTETGLKKGTTDPIFNHKRLVKIDSVNQMWVDFFLNGHIIFELYGQQQDSKGDPKLAKMTTRELRQLQVMQKTSMIQRRDTKFSLSIQEESDSKLKSDFIMLERKYERLVEKERRLQQVCYDWQQKSSAEQQFQPFYAAISAIVNSSGTKFKTTAKLLTKMLAIKHPTENGTAGKASKGGESDSPKGSSTCTLM